jgi:hypothetical protein
MLWSFGKFRIEGSISAMVVEYRKEKKWWFFKIPKKQLA